jgi:DNA-binding NarL/FixJ family response regulator
VANGGEAADACLEHEVDVALIDLRLADVQGVEAAADVRARSPATAVVFLSASVDADEPSGHVAGRSLVRKDAGVEVLLDAVRASARSGA